MSEDTADIQKRFPPAKYEAAVDYNPLNKRKFQVDPDNNEEIREKNKWGRKGGNNPNPINK